MNHSMEVIEVKSDKLANMVDLAAKLNKMQENAFFTSQAE